MIEIDNLLDVEKYIEDIDVVIFDLDDTLYNELDYAKSGFKAIDKVYPNTFNRLWKLILEKKKPLDEVFLDEKEKLNALDIYRRQIPDIKLIPGALELLNKIKKSNKKLGMITDGDPIRQNTKIDVLGIRDLFNKIIITDELGGIEYRKPNPKAYEIMQEYFNVPYTKMAYIGDNTTKDFITPEQYKMKAIHFNNKIGRYY